MYESPDQSNKIIQKSSDLWRREIWGTKYFLINITNVRKKGRTSWCIQFALNIHINEFFKAFKINSNIIKLKTSLTLILQLFYFAWLVFDLLV
jgi:hypothetical protein